MDDEEAKVYVERLRAKAMACDALNSIAILLALVSLAISLYVIFVK